MVGRTIRGLCGVMGDQQRPFSYLKTSGNTALRELKEGVLVSRSLSGQTHEVELTERDRAILDFERSWWANDAPKDQQVQERFELSLTRYYQLLVELLDMPEAALYDPLVVRRLQRQRDRRRQARRSLMIDETVTPTGSTGDET